MSGFSCLSCYKIGGVRLITAVDIKMPGLWYVAS